MYLLEDHITLIDDAARSQRLQNDIYLASLSYLDEKIWKHSKAVDVEDVKASGSFTTLQVRKNIHDDAANAASDRVMEDWAKYIQDGQEKLTLNGRSELGNLYSFTFIESDPERLDVVSYWGDLGLLHDGKSHIHFVFRKDHSEAAKETQAWNEHEALGAGINFHEAASGKGLDMPRTLGLKRMAAESMLAGMALDRERCLYMVDKYRTDWVDVVENPRPENGFSTLVEYMNYRNHNVGMSAFWPMVSFAMGWTPSDEENNLVQHVLEPIEEGICLTNDYWSWEREIEDHRTNGNRLNNAVQVGIDVMGLDEESAKKWLAERLIGLECEYVHRKVQFYRTHQNISIELRRWIDQAGCILASTHYWASSCPRHHEWKSHREHAHAAELQQESDVDSSHDDDSGRTTSDSSNSSDTSVSKVHDHCLIFGHKHGEPSSTALTYASELMAPIEYISSMPSKGVRAMLVEAFNVWLKVPESSMQVIDTIIADLHNASLILDDIEDDSDLRRGQPATHLVYGTGLSINSANFMFVRSVQKAHRELKSPRAVLILLEALQVMYEGQAKDLHWKFFSTPPTISQYIDMIDGKTGGLFQMLLKLAEAETDGKVATESMDRLVILFGRFFQIRDDYMNLCSKDYAKQKGAYEDLDEGKFSYPLVQLFELQPHLRFEVLGMFRSREDRTQLSVQAKERILSHLKSSGALNATLRFLQELEKNIEVEIEKVERNCDERNSILRLLLVRLAVRE